MKVRSAAILICFFPVLAFAGRGDAVCNNSLKDGYTNSITAPAVTGSNQDTFADLAICFQGKDYSQVVAKSTRLKGLPGDDLKVLSSYSVDDFEEMYFSLYNEETKESAITRVVVNSFGRLSAVDGGLVSNHQIKDSDQGAIFTFVPSYKKDAVYFNVVDSQRITLYKFRHLPGYANSAANVVKIADGHGEWVKKNGDIILSRTRVVEGIGREVYGVIVAPDGKKKCELDASDSAWVISALSECE